MDSSFSDSFRPAAAAAATVRAAKPEAEEARPAATGKLLSETIFAFSFIPAIFLIRLM